MDKVQVRLQILSLVFRQDREVSSLIATAKALEEYVIESESSGTFETDAHDGSPSSSALAKKKVTPSGLRKKAENSDLFD